MDALAEVYNEENHLRDAGLLQSATVLTAHSSAGRSLSARPVAPIPLASPPVVPPATHGESVGLHYDHCGRDGHVEAFCYRKKKLRRLRFTVLHRVLVVPVLEDLRGILLVQRHERFSCCFVALWPLRHQELLVLLLHQP
jgi:hypothetical protein